MTFPIHASCQCGQVTYTIKRAPKKVMACHCTECQKLATGPYSVTAIIDADAIDFHGELKQWSRVADSGNVNLAFFCPDCGNRIYHLNPDDPQSIKLKLKPVDLEDDSLFEPTAHIWAGKKLRWFTIPDGVPVFDKQP